MRSSVSEETVNMTTRVAAIIATFNGSDYILSCIQSLLEGNVVPKIIVVDNNSRDNTLDIIRNNFDGIHIIELSQNHGFGYANNIGIAYAISEFNADYFFLINQDTIVNNNSIEHLLKASIKHPEFGIISPLHFNNKNSLDTNFENYIKTYYNYIIGKSDEIVHEVNFVNAAAWLITRDCINYVGGFDTSIFFHYGEDHNYCQRVIYHGLKIGFITNSSIIHFRSNKTVRFDQIKALDIILLRRRTEMADILVSHEVMNKLYKVYLASIFKILIKSISTFNFRKSWYLIKELITGNIFIKSKLMRSRNKNRNIGPHWLNPPI